MYRSGEDENDAPESSNDEKDDGRLKRYWKRLKCFSKIPRVLFFYDAV